MLTRYWFKFELLPPYHPLRKGCGVTAYTYNDAMKLLMQSLFKDTPMPPVQEVIENIDISTLDQKHIIPNMESPTWRGVWFPKGYRLLHGH
jgi:hypothetical protein